MGLSLLRRVFSVFARRSRGEIDLPRISCGRLNIRCRDLILARQLSTMAANSSSRHSNRHRVRA